MVAGLGWEGFGKLCRGTTTGRAWSMSPALKPGNIPLLESSSIPRRMFTSGATENPEFLILSMYDWNAVTRRGHTEMNKHKSGSHLRGLISLVTADDSSLSSLHVKWWFKLSRHAVHVSLYFATHFVNLARLSSHAFHDRFLHIGCTDSLNSEF